MGILLEVEIYDHNVCMKMETIQLDWGNSASAFFVRLMEHKSTLENTESLLSKLLVLSMWQEIQLFTFNL